MSRPVRVRVDARLHPHRRPDGDLFCALGILNAFYEQEISGEGLWVQS